MSSKLENICRLCLKVAEKASEIDETAKQMFHILLIKLDLGVTKNPIICQDCMEVGKKCLSFKFTCIDTEKVILSYSAYKKEAKHNIKVIYKERKHIMRIVFDENFDICRICMIRLEKNNFVVFHALTNEYMFEMLRKYMVEVDINTVENPMICANCTENLDVYFKFVVNCVDTEEKIKAYRLEKGTDRTDEVKLGHVLQFMLTDILGYPDKCSQTCKVNQDDTGHTYPKPYSELIKQEELDIKDEETILNEEHLYRSEIKANEDSDAYLPKEYHNETIVDMIGVDMRERKIEGNAYKKNCQENFTGDHENDSSILQINKRLMCAGETKGRAHGKNDLIGNRDVPKLDIYQGILYTAEIKQQDDSNDDVSNSKGNSEPKQTVVQIGTSDPQSYIPVDVGISSMFKCSLCSFESKYKWNLNTHMSIHKDVSEVKMFKCSFCAYQARQKGSLNKHMLVHKDISEIKMIRCSFCTYEAKHKDSLKSHMVIHKDVSEIEMFKCSSCPFESKHKSSLKSHMLVHKDVSEIQTFKCSLCAYESRHKGSLNKHLLVHKDISEIKMLRCSFCTYEARHKDRLKSHMVIHKDVSKIEMFKCSSCPFESKHKCSLKSHMLIHKDVSEVQTFKCSLCSFESKHKRSLKSHMLVHRDVSEIQTFKCALCAYAYKHKSSLKTHMLIHQDVSEVQTSKCSLCSFESKHKRSLKSHMLVHRDVSEIQTFKCALCAYAFKRKSSLKTHMLIHKDVSEIQMFKCSLCSFETKYKGNLKSHILVHKDV